MDIEGEREAAGPLYVDVEPRHGRSNEGTDKVR